MPMVNPDEPFVAEDGLVYEDLAAFLLGKPDESWRNTQVRHFRTFGTPEAHIREWIKLFDGNEAPRTQAQLLADSSSRRAKRSDDILARLIPLDKALTGRTGL